MLIILGEIFYFDLILLPAVVIGIC